MFGSDYHDCTMCFAKSFTLGEEKTINLADFSDALVLKCLREVNDDNIVKHVCEKTDLHLITKFAVTVISQDRLLQVNGQGQELDLQLNEDEDNHFVDL